MQELAQVTHRRNSDRIVGEFGGPLVVRHVLLAIATAFLFATSGSAHPRTDANEPTRARRPGVTPGKSGRSHPGPLVTYPGFQILDDGGSRVFVELTESTDVTEQVTAHKLAYTIKRARIESRNNQNPLVTLHFNTPVARASLRPLGPDVELRIELRADSPHTFHVAAGEEGSVFVQVDFPKGTFIPKSNESEEP